MARIPRLLVKGEDTIYHIVSRTALSGYVLGDVEKDYLLSLIKELSGIFFVEVFGFCIMGNHFHLLVKMKTIEDYSNEEVKRRLSIFRKCEVGMITDGQVPIFKEKFSNLSEFMKELKQRFSRYYNRLHERRGYFWGDRFKSVIVENGDTLINCLAYIDLNPIRAGLAAIPEEYRWSSVGYHAQTCNKGAFLSTDFGLNSYGEMSETERLTDYREFLYEKGAIETVKGISINNDVIKKERDKDYKLTSMDRLRFKTRYFTDSGIIGTKGFVSHYYEMFKGCFNSRNEKKPKKISGFDGIYSLKRLANET